MRSSTRRGFYSHAFTLIELLVVIAIVSLLMSILVPTLSRARQEARATQCLGQLHVLGQGLVIYVDENREAMPPSRLPKLSGNCNPAVMIYGRLKYRPTFVATMSTAVGVPPFDDPKECKNQTDMHGEPGDRQNYSYPLYVCPSVSDWTDERNGAYGYNYQFLGNSRLLNENDPNSPYKNWPVRLGQIRYPARTVMAGDGMGTAASWPPMARLPYGNNTRDPQRYGDEGFNLDPPWVDPVNGEMASLPDHRSAADPRHRGKAGILWVDGHAGSHTLEQLGYRLDEDGRVALEGDNSQWTGNGQNVPWTPEFKQ